MKRSCLLMAFVLVAAACSNGVNPEDLKCAINNDCQTGYLCNSELKCVSASPLRITTESLPAAVAGGPYQAVLNGEGGLLPYRWGLEAASGKTLPGWLSVDPATGVLSGTVSDRAGTQWEVVGTVTDHSNGGSGETVRRTYVLLVKECEGNERCYTVSGKDCVEGERVCVDGVLGSCAAGTQVSTDMMHCGAEGMECGACDLRADNCAGECKCGGGKACGATQACCGGKCEDVNASVENCGGCGKKCDRESMHVVEATCVGGECGYNANKGCAAGYYDCNGDVKDGCETEMSAKNCGGCGDDCTDGSVYVHTSGVPCEGGVCAVGGHCVAGWADCTQEKGCETDLSSVNSCGGCTSRCYADAQGVGGLCLGDAASGYRCGCIDATNEGCTAERICCGGLCRARDAANCVGCDQACSIEDGGLHCDLGTFTCDCDNDFSKCREPYPDFSFAMCSNITNKCLCTNNDNPPYSGTLEDMCCQSGAVGVRVNLWSNASHCGICNARCWSGMVCDNGACLCDMGKPCPGNSNAPDCVNGLCACSYHGNNPCPPGQYCCNVPGTDPRVGCCRRACTVTTAQGNKCSSSCSKTWCTSGKCCTSCDPDVGCD